MSEKPPIQDPPPPIASKDALPPYLKDNSWEQELNYKLWATSSVRFQAARRCEYTAHLSSLAIAFLTGYLIIIGLIPFVPHPALKSVPPDLLGVGTADVSIMLLAYSLIENAKSHGLKAHLYHDCALAISRLYNALRQAKEITDTAGKRAEIARITAEYERVLPSYMNHQPIDYEIFKTQKPGWFKLTPKQIKSRQRTYYWQVKARCHLIIAIPPVLVVIMLLIPKA
jgi:hypothetical protein